jgi:hypothetical protein
MRLPLDVIGVIAEHLVESFMHGTCAALNATGRLVREQTLPVLYGTCVMGFQEWTPSLLSRDLNQAKTTFPTEDFRNMLAGKGAKWIM